MVISLFYESTIILFFYEKRSAGNEPPIIITEGKIIGENSGWPWINSSINKGKIYSTVIAYTLKSFIQS